MSEQPSLLDTPIENLPDSVPVQEQPAVPASFGTDKGFALIQRVATAFSRSQLVPREFQNNLPNCIIAVEMAQRLGASPMAVMQELYIVHGKPSWSSKFIIAALNSTKKFSPLRFEMSGEKDTLACRAWATELATEERLEGPKVTMQMAKDEGWLDKSGSKWKTMPELMIRYRAATFFGRLYAPEVLMGMQSMEEIRDTFDMDQDGDTWSAEVADKTANRAEALKAKIASSKSKESGVEQAPLDGK